LWIFDDSPEHFKQFLLVRTVRDIGGAIALVGRLDVAVYYATFMKALAG
jgi:hypothetical protein